METVDETMLPLSSDFDSLRSRRLKMAPKKPGGAAARLAAAAATGPPLAAVTAVVTVLPIPPDASSNGDIPLFIAFKMPWFGWVCGCLARNIQKEITEINYISFHLAGGGFKLC